jgi:hypothetical protein
LPQKKKSRASRNAAEIILQGEYKETFGKITVQLRGAIPQLPLRPTTLLSFRLLYKNAHFTAFSTN